MHENGISTKPYKKGYMGCRSGMVACDNACNSQPGGGRTEGAPGGISRGGGLYHDLS